MIASSLKTWLETVPDSFTIEVVHDVEWESLDIMRIRAVPTDNRILYMPLYEVEE